ncbi:MAG: hypothetical protein WD005_03790 [Haliea sp.]
MKKVGMLIGLLLAAQLSWASNEQAADATSIQANNLTATVILKRENGNARTRNITFRLMLNNAYVGRIKAGNVTTLEVPVGEHTLVSSLNEEPFTFVVKPGETFDINVAVERKAGKFTSLQTRATPS